ncbi:nucleotidyl cyclase domain-containing protein [Actinomadura physcomitrii]|uniref:hypothetical protein n=1 Tax=Actinomadura physcomitrii TaxID=2650748 RepID=UPI00192338EC|nr:hypothetical protein [Actinomadura physcomitrii]
MRERGRPVARSGRDRADDRDTVIGDPVNEAARLTDLAKATEARVLASGSLVATADPEEAAQWGPARRSSCGAARGRPGSPRRAGLPGRAQDGPSVAPLSVV